MSQHWRFRQLTHRKPLCGLLLRARRRNSAMRIILLTALPLTGNRTADFLLDIVPMIGVFILGFFLVFSAPNKMRKESDTDKKRIRLVKRLGIALLVIQPIAILWSVFDYLAKRN